VVLDLTFDEKSAKGAWSLREKGSNSDVISGTLALSRT
jgi:hypothetical protein